MTPRLRSVVLAAGGTAGHVEPALALADALRAAHPDLSITLLGTAEGLESRLAPARGYPLAVIPRVPMPRRPGTDLLRLPPRLIGAVRAARGVLSRERADVLVGFGGYVAAAGYLAAASSRVPIVVHEANPLPGMANRLGARLTRSVAVSRPGTPLRHAVLTGLPLRPEILSLDRSPAARATAAARYGLDPGEPTLLVFGGSQGARQINRAVAGAAAELVAAGIQVLHAAGRAAADDVQREVAALLPAGAPGAERYHAVGYLDDMASAYAAADLALCRAGAMTCAELSCVGLPAVYVPLPIGNGEQRLNAEPVVAAGGGVIVSDAELSPERVRGLVVPLLSDPEQLAAMAAGARISALPDAASALVALVERAADVRRR